MKFTGAPLARRRLLLLALGCQLALLGLLASGANARTISKRHSHAEGPRAAPASATSATTKVPAAGAGRAAGEEEPKLVISLTSDESKEKLKEAGAKPVAGSDDQMELPTSVTTSGLPDEVSGTLMIKAPFQDVLKAAKTLEGEIKAKGSSEGLNEDALAVLQKIVELPESEFVELSFGRKEELEMVLRAVMVMLEFINKQLAGDGPKPSEAPTTKKPVVRLSRLGEIELLRLLSVLSDLDRYKIKYSRLLSNSQISLLAKHVNLAAKRVKVVVYTDKDKMIADVKEIRRIRVKLEKARDDHREEMNPKGVSQMNGTQIEVITSIYQLVESFGNNQEAYRDYLSFTEREFLKNLVRDKNGFAIRLPIFTSERERMLYVMRLNSVFKALLKARAMVPVTTRKPGVYTLGALLIQNLTKILDLKSLYDPEFGIKKANLTEEEMRVFRKTIKLDVRRIMIYSYTDKALRDSDAKLLQSVTTKVYKLQDLYVSRPRSKTTKKPDGTLDELRTDEQVVAVVKTSTGFAVRRLSKDNMADILKNRVNSNVLRRKGFITVSGNNSFLIPKGEYSLPESLRIVGLAV